MTAFTDTKASAATANKRSTLTFSGKPLDAESRIETSELLISDRCDRCGSRAYVRAVNGTHELLFCGSDARKSMAKLIADGWKLDDQTYRAFDGCASATSSFENA